VVLFSFIYRNIIMNGYSTGGDDMKDAGRDRGLLEARASLLKAIAHPVRLCILRGLLETGECNVSTMQHCMGAPQSTISQHLQKLRAERVVGVERHGVEVYYHIDDASRELIKGMLSGIPLRLTEGLER
jgi:DNA-binding transcriptional ArsR family regulator